MKVEIINNPGSASCAPGPQTVDRGMRSSVEPSAGEASPTQQNEHPQRPTRRSNVYVRVVEGEVVMLDRQAGLIHQLNHTASHIWGLCDGQRTLAQRLRSAFEPLQSREGARLSLTTELAPEFVYAELLITSLTLQHTECAQTAGDMM